MSSALRSVFIGVLACCRSFACRTNAHRSSPTISRLFPLSEVKPGMKGVAYTIFTGDEVEKVDLVVIGILQNALGPKQDVILVQLLGGESGAFRRGGRDERQSCVLRWQTGRRAFVEAGRVHEGSDWRRDADREHAPVVQEPEPAKNAYAAPRADSSTVRAGSRTRRCAFHCPRDLRNARLRARESARANF